MSLFKAVAPTLIVLPLAAMAGPFDGLYRPNYDWAESWDCATPGVEGGALAIAADSVQGIGAPCNLSAPVEVRGMNAALYDMTCPGDAEGATRRIMILGHQFGVYVITDGQVLDWLRCDRP